MRRCALFVVTALAVGCYETVPLIGKRCDATHPCPEGLFCVNEVCLASAAGGGGGGGAAGSGDGGGSAGGTAGGTAGGAAGGAPGGGSGGAPAAGFQPAGRVIGGARSGHAATLLASGAVLITGGSFGQTPTNETVVYDPATGTSVLGPPMQEPHSGHVAVRVPDGRVVVADSHHVARSIEIYDPASPDAGWSLVGPMLSAHQNLRAFWVGPPVNQLALFGGISPLSELFDPATGQCTDGGALAAGPDKRPAVQLADGRPLLLFPAAETYEPASAAWRPSPDDTLGEHFEGFAVALRDGGVLVGGGYSWDYAAQWVTEVLQPNGFVAADPVPFLMVNPLTAQLPSGNVLLVSPAEAFTDAGRSYAPAQVAFVFDFDAGRWRDAGTTGWPHHRGTLTQLPNGALLLCGGGLDMNATDRCETFVE